MEHTISLLNFAAWFFIVAGVVVYLGENKRHSGSVVLVIFGFLVALANMLIQDGILFKK